MIPFWSAGGTSFHATKMLFELRLRPTTLAGAAVGSEKKVHEIGIQIFLKFLTKN